MGTPNESILRLLAPDIVASNRRQIKYHETTNIGLRLNNYIDISVEDVLALNAIFQNYLIGDGFLQNVVVDDGPFKVIP
jgi:hypothetical protein